jgi:hypothetical protein
LIPDPKNRDGLKPADPRFLEIVDKHGCQVMSVVPAVGKPSDSFSYSTGIFLRFRHPEIILFGLSPERKVINIIGRQTAVGFFGVARLTKISLLEE